MIDLRDVSPSRLHPTDHPLGRPLADEPPPLGYHRKPPRGRASSRISVLRGEGHVLTIAPTGAGKGVGCVLPLLLQSDCPAIVVDVKGENYLVTARYRREVLGHRVVALDPFGVLPPESLPDGPGALNPFDLVRPDHIDTDCEAIAELLIGGRTVSKNDPFWDHVSRAFLVGAIAHVATRTSGERTAKGLRELLYGDDVAYALAVLLDTKLVPDPLAQEEFKAFLNHEAQKVRPSVLSTAQVAMRVLAGSRVLATLGPSTFRLDDIVAGAPVDVFLVVPPEHLDSHGPLLRLWVGTLLHALSRRSAIPAKPTLFVLDEAAALGELNALRRAITLLRGYGVRTLTLWQDLSQLQRLYEDWQTILHNCAVIQAFGIGSWSMARALAEVLGVPAARILELPADRQLVTAAGHPTREMVRLDVRRDAPFARRATPNPRYGAGTPRPPEREAERDGR